MKYLPLFGLFVLMLVTVFHTDTFTMRVANAGPDVQCKDVLFQCPDGSYSGFYPPTCSPNCSGSGSGAPVVTERNGWWYPALDLSTPTASCGSGEVALVPTLYDGQSETLLSSGSPNSVSFRLYDNSTGGLVSEVSGTNYPLPSLCINPASQSLKVEIGGGASYYDFIYDLGILENIFPDVVPGFTYETRIYLTPRSFSGAEYVPISPSGNTINSLRAPFTASVFPPASIVGSAPNTSKVFFYNMQTGEVSTTPNSYLYGDIPSVLGDLAIPDGVYKWKLRTSLVIHPLPPPPETNPLAVESSELGLVANAIIGLGPGLGGDGDLSVLPLTFFSSGLSNYSDPFILDTKAPPTTQGHTPTIPKTTEQITITAQATDELAGVTKIQVFVDGAVAQTCTFAGVASAECVAVAGPFGNTQQHSYYVVAEDSAGNITTTPTVTVVPNDNPPVVDAGKDVNIAVTTAQPQSASVTDPDNNLSSIQWEFVSGPGPVLEPVVTDGVANGLTWTARSVTEANMWYSITYGNGLFVAVSGDGTNRVMTSSDGITWTASLVAGSNFWRSVTYGNGLFVAVASTGTNRVMTSPDGVTWTSYSVLGDNDLWYSVVYGNGTFVAVGYGGGAFGSGDRIMTSPNGITWTAQSAAEANIWYSVTYGNGTFVAVSLDGTNRVMTSPNGITWTAQSAAEANSWYSITYGNGIFVAVSLNGTNRVMTSPNGITWTARVAQPATWRSVTYGNGLFVAVGYTLNSSMSSADGITWTANIVPEANSWYSVTYGNGLFVAVSGDGTNRVMTSSGLDVPTPTFSGMTTPGTYTYKLTATDSGGASVSDTMDVNVNLQCAGTTMNHCNLPATAQGGSAGSCENGYSGACTYLCAGVSPDTWSESINTCVPQKGGVIDIVPPTPVNKGELVEVIWSTWNIPQGIDCELQGTNGDLWLGSSGRVNSKPLTETTDFVLSCGEDILEIVRAVVNPDVFITARSRVVRAGDLVTIEWNLNENDPAVCMLTGPGITTNPVNAPTGSVSVTVEGKSTYTLQCQDQTAQVVVGVIPSMWAN